jgi:hypothetical protein
LAIAYVRLGRLGDAGAEAAKIKRIGCSRLSALPSPPGAFSCEGVGFDRRPFIIPFAYNPRKTLPAARTKKPSNKSENPVCMCGTLI